MKLSSLLPIIITLLSTIPAEAVQIIPASQDTWTCFDYSTDYHTKNPEWGIVSLSYNPGFRGVSHMVNYKFTENGALKIHDGLYQRDYTIYEWQGAYYYHFWLPEETPIRNYMTLQDNSRLFTNNTQEEEYVI